MAESSDIIMTSRDYNLNKENKLVDLNDTYMSNLELKWNGSLDYIVSVKCQKLTVWPEPKSSSTVCKISRCIDLRKKWISIHPNYPIIASCTNSSKNDNSYTSMEGCSLDYSVYDRDISCHTQSSASILYRPLENLCKIHNKVLSVVIWDYYCAGVSVLSNYWCCSCTVGDGW